MNDETVRYLEVGHFDCDDIIFVFSVMRGSGAPLRVWREKMSSHDIEEELYLADVRHTILDWDYLVDDMCGDYGVRRDRERGCGMRDSRNWVVEWVMPHVLALHGTEGLRGSDLLDAYMKGEKVFGLCSRSRAGGEWRIPSGKMAAMEAAGLIDAENRTRAAG